ASTAQACSGCWMAGSSLLSPPTLRLSLRAAAVLSHTEDARMSLVVCSRGRLRRESASDLSGLLLAPANVCRTRGHLVRRTEYCRLSKARREGISSTPRE